MGLAGTDSQGGRLLELLRRRRHRYLRGPAGRRLSDHREDPDHRPQPAGGARGPRAEIAADSGTDGRAPWSTWTAMIGGLDAHHRRRLRQRLPHPAAGGPHLPHGARARQDPDGGPASAHLALLARRDRRQTQPRGSFHRGGPAALRSGVAGSGRPGLARGGQAPARPLEERQPPDHPGGAGHAAVSGEAPPYHTPTRAQACLRRLRRRRYGDCGFHAGARRGRLSRRSRRAGQSAPAGSSSANWAPPP